MESALMMVRLAFDLDMDKSRFLLRSLYSSGSSPRSSPKNMRRTCSSAASSPLSSPMINRRMTAMMKQPSFEAASSIVMNPLTQLPPELAFHIISFLSCKDVLHLSQTSRAGYEYANDESVWKNLINLELGLSFLGGCELIFDEHMERRHNRNHNDPSAAKAQDPMELECPAAPSKTWKERFQYLVSIKAELGPVQFRSMKPSRLPVVTTTAGSGAVQIPSPCGSSDCSGRCAAGQAPASLGCKHYKRDCKLLTACCGRFFVCRHCHDEQVHDHRIDRYATQLVLCMVCNAIQPVGHNCASPQCQNRPLGSYFCGVCKFYDNDPDKAIFHCEHCQVCKLGRKSESFHCHSCGRCFSKAVMATHPCLNKQGQQGQQTTTEER